MNTKYFAFNDSSNAQIQKHIIEIAPNVKIPILALYFVIEPKIFTLRACLMISAQKRDAVWPFYFIAEEKKEDLNRIVTTANIVTHEHISSIW